MADYAGIIFAILSAIANGTFTVPSKLEPAKRSGVEPSIFNLYVGIGVGASSLLVPLLLRIPFSFTWLGVLSGLLLSISSMNAFAAVKLLGVSAASGIWCGVAVVVSFSFGYFFEQPVSNVPLALVSIFALVVSICGIAYSEKVSTKTSEEYSMLSELIPEGEGFVKGVLAGIIAGVFGGLILAPEHYAPSNASGLAFVFSFGVGTLLTSPVVNLLPNVFCGGKPEFHFHETAPLGLLAGVVWTVQNITAILAIGKIGYSIAYPIVQCGLFVAGLWGILLFGEIQGPSQKLYWLSGGILVAGAIALNFSK